MPETYDVGDRPTITATFTSTAGVLTDPSTVVFRWRDPAGVETGYTYLTDSQVTRTSLGVFAFTPPTIALAGAHWCRAKGTAGLIAAGETGVGVRASQFTTT